jgi:hypothetical protein
MLNCVTAQKLHAAAQRAGALVIWLVSDADPEYPGKVVARPHTADSHGRVFLAGALVAGTLDELHVMMPVGLRAHPREVFHLPEIVEAWE